MHGGHSRLIKSTGDHKRESLMKTVLMVANNLSPKRGSESGKANQWLRIVEKYFKVIVLTDKKHEKDIQEETYLNVDFEYVEINQFVQYWLWKYGFHHLTYKIFLYNSKVIFEKILNKYDVSIIHCITPAGIHSYNKLYKYNIPLLIGPLGGGLPTHPEFKKAFRGQLIKCFFRDSYYRLIKKSRNWEQYFTNGKKIIVGTPLVAEMLPQRAQEKCSIIFDCVVDVNYFKPLNENKENQPLIILFAASLEGKKGILILLEAIKACTRKGLSGFVLHVAGEGNLKSKIESYIIDNNLQDFVKLLGKLPKKEMLLAYQHADIFCLPTLREPGGNSILEAMACGLPIVTTNYGGPSYSVGDECGIKINLENYSRYISDLSEALAFLLGSREMRVRMGLAARKRVEAEFSPGALERKIIDVYGEVI
jgi:glycosyltransferase involved in cell wall biosynthesis